MAYTLAEPMMGFPDIGAYYTSLGTPGVGNLPSVTTAPQLGTVASFWDATLGYAKGIFLKIPVSTAVPAGTVVNWDNNYQVRALPAKSTSAGTGVPMAVAYTAAASSTSVQYGWFIIQGNVATLKTAVTASPNSAIYASATAGRIYFTSSTKNQALGSRTQNTATITTTTSTVTVYFNFSSMEGP